jgi:hypothetical protein
VAPRAQVAPGRVDERELVQIQDDFSGTVSAEAVDRDLELGSADEIELADEAQRMTGISRVVPEVKLVREVKLTGSHGG